MKKETYNVFRIWTLFVFWQNSQEYNSLCSLLLAATATSCLSVNFLLEYSTSSIPYILCKHNRSCVLFRVPFAD